ncbi:exopolygalacturonase PelB [Flavobacteriaceae bacterium GF1]
MKKVSEFANSNRFHRSLFKVSPFGLCAFCLLLGSCGSKLKKTDFETTIEQHLDSAWNITMPKILKNIFPPSFKTDTVIVVNGNRFVERLNDSIVILSKRGGGVVHIPKGVYKVKGPVLLDSNINLNLAEGVELIFSNNPNDYLPTVKARWEGTFAMNYSPLIYAVGKTNIAITGKGEINGNCQDTWGQWKPKQNPDKKTIRQYGNDKVPLSERIFGDGHYLRPTGIEFIECKNILLEDFTIHHTPFWTIHPVLSENITARRLNIQMGVRNDDGIDPEHCKNVLIEKCTINTWDDCIAIKAGRDQDGWDYPPSENIIIRDNAFTNVVGSGFCIGSEMSGGVRNVFVENNTLRGSEKHAFQFKSNPDRGGFIEQVYMRNMKVMAPVSYGFEFTTDYAGWRGNEHFVKYNDFYFQNIEMEAATKISIKINGREEENIHRVFMENITIKKSLAPMIANHVEDLVLKNVSINGKTITKKDVTTEKQK